MRTKIKKITILSIGIIIAMILCLLLLYLIGSIQFNKRLQRVAEPQLSMSERFFFDEPLSEKGSFSWPEDISYQKGQTLYQFHQKQFVLYFMGIDDDDKVTSHISSEGGQADAHFLIFIDMESRSIRILTLNRNTMTDIDIYDLYNNYGYTIPGQLCLQHAYGDGLHDSCKRSLDAVRRCLNNMPIHAYVSLNKGVIAALNDAVGGVRVIALEDIIFPEPETIIHKGDDILLKGSDAYYYLTHRYTANFGSNNTRLERQKQYLHTLLGQIKDSVLQNPLQLYKLYRLARDYMVTDLSIPEMFYLSTLVMTYQIDTTIVSIPGETFDEALYETFYPDEEARENTILEYYYQH